MSEFSTPTRPRAPLSNSQAQIFGSPHDVTIDFGNDANDGQTSTIDNDVSTVTHTSETHDKTHKPAEEDMEDDVTKPMGVDDLDPDMYKRPSRSPSVSLTPSPSPTSSPSPPPIAPPPPGDAPPPPPGLPDPHGRRTKPVTPPQDLFKVTKKWGNSIPIISREEARNAQYLFNKALKLGELRKKKKRCEDQLAFNEYVTDALKKGELTKLQALHRFITVAENVQRQMKERRELNKLKLEEAILIDDIKLETEKPIVTRDFIRRTVGGMSNVNYSVPFKDVNDTSGVNGRNVAPGFRPREIVVPPYNYRKNGPVKPYKPMDTSPDIDARGFVPKNVTSATGNSVYRRRNAVKFAKNMADWSKETRERSKKHRVERQKQRVIRQEKSRLKSAIESRRTVGDVVPKGQEFIQKHLEKVAEKKADIKSVKDHTKNIMEMTRQKIAAKNEGGDKSTKKDSTTTQTEATDSTEKVSKKDVSNLQELHNDISKNTLNAYMKHVNEKGIDSYYETRRKNHETSLKEHYYLTHPNIPSGYISEEIAKSRKARPKTNAKEIEHTKMIKYNQAVQNAYDKRGKVSAEKAASLIEVFKNIEDLTNDGIKAQFGKYNPAEPAFKYARKNLNAAMKTKDPKTRQNKIEKSIKDYTWAYYKALKGIPDITTAELRKLGVSSN